MPEEGFDEQIKHILARHDGGVFKRIDENRELLETLLRDAPGLLDKQPWIVRWLESQDQFLCALQGVAPVTGAQFPQRPKPAEFPRPWPL